MKAWLRSPNPVKPLGRKTATAPPRRLGSSSPLFWTLVSAKGHVLIKLRLSTGLENLQLVKRIKDRKSSAGVSWIPHAPTGSDRRRIFLVRTSAGPLPPVAP